MTAELLRDPGMQQERTTLAWRRTGLALLVGALTIGRLTLEVLGPVVVVATVFSVALALHVVADSLRRGRLAHAHPDDPRFSVLRDGRVVAAVSLGLVLLALVELGAALALFA